MQKKLIALAIAGLASSAAFAQSNVTIYGIVDVAYTHSSSGSSSTSGIDSGGWSSSRLGFRGTEDLGDGLKALFTLEYGLSPDVNSGVGVTSTGGGNERQGWIGLQNNTGSIKVGRQNTLGKNATDKYDPMASTTFSPLYALQRGNFVTATQQSFPTNDGTIPYALQTVNGRFSNSVTFESAKMSGFVISAQYAFNGQDGLDANAYGGAGQPQKKQSDVTFGVEYSDGPLALNYIHQRARDIIDTTAPAVSNKASENWVSGAYDFGVVKLMGSYQTVQRTQGGVKFATDKLLSVGVQVPVTAVGKVYFGYAKANDASPANNDVDSWGVQYSHELSKRTILYSGYQRLSNDNLAAAQVLPNTGGRATVAAGANASGWGFGVRHTF